VSASHLPCQPGPKGTGYRVVPDAAAFTPVVEALYDLAFGPGRHTKAASRLRERALARLDLSRVLLDNRSDLVAACRMHDARLADGRVVAFLGPIAVHPALQGLGLGRQLCGAVLGVCDAAREGPVVLVGDPRFFGGFGFTPVPQGRLLLPWPVDPARLLWRQCPACASEGGQPPVGSFL
jgi:predicted N-acetyltransferase YhbS